MGNVFEQHSYTVTKVGGPHFPKEVIPCAGQRGPSPAAPSPAEFSAGLAGSGPTRSRRGERPRCSSSSRPGPVFAATKGWREGGAGSRRHSHSGKRRGMACAPLPPARPPPSIHPPFTPSLQAAAALDGRNLSRGAAVPGQTGAGKHMAEVTMAAPCSLSAAPPSLPPPALAETRCRYRFACGPCHRWSARRTRPGAPPSSTSSRPGAAPHAQGRDWRARRGGMAGAARGTLGTRPAARGGGGAGHAPRGAGPHPEPAQSRSAAPPGLELRLVGAGEQRRRETGRGWGASTSF